MPSAAPVHFLPAPADRRAGRALLSEMREEILSRLGGVDFDAEGMPEATPAALAPPSGVFMIGVLDGRVVCGGGLKRLDDLTCEIKRMYVRPDARGRGISRQLLVELETQARRLGCSVARLDTSSRLPRAKELFRAAGYAEIANFNGDPVADYFAEKVLAD